MVDKIQFRRSGEWTIVNDGGFEITKGAYSVGIVQAEEKKETSNGEA